jgi:hypothetical protein
MARSDVAGKDFDAEKIACKDEGGNYLPPAGVDCLVPKWASHTLFSVLFALSLKQNEDYLGVVDPLPAPAGGG